jgi:rhodanese-related sulfurtransferase
LIYDKATGVILGGQTAGYEGADRRLDVIATAAATKLTVSDLADVDYAYSPPLGTANDAINMAAFTAENRMSGFSPSVTVSELDAYLEGKNPIFIDVRDIFAYEKSHIMGAMHIPLELLPEKLGSIPANRPVIVYDETGKKGHQALRTLIGAGFADVTNVSGGHASLQRQARAVGFKNLKIELLEIEKKSIGKKEKEVEVEVESVQSEDLTSPIIVDVRTPQEFRSGAVPNAINISLDELMNRYNELGENLDREIIVYCATGARSAYAQRMLMQIGYTNVKNGGGLHAMMAQARSSEQPKQEAKQVSSEPLVVDVRTRGEFMSGAFPGAVNIDLDQLATKVNELGDKNREIVLYCASGARSAYGVRVLESMGFTNVKNGGGLMQMMRR